uniref:Uncharacterized protein n=1 Tax=Timema cristinae TaxID=61476 RepID=A0A7R9D476_TIMCR|nr:unnamed protein product [Timema cristinae]
MSRMRLPCFLVSTPCVSCGSLVILQCDAPSPMLAQTTHGNNTWPRRTAAIRVPTVDENTKKVNTLLDRQPLYKHFKRRQTDHGEVLLRKSGLTNFLLGLYPRDREDVSSTRPAVSSEIVPEGERRYLRHNLQFPRRLYPRDIEDVSSTRPAVPSGIVVEGDKRYLLHNLQPPLRL